MSGHGRCTTVDVMKSRLGLANTAFSFWLATVTFASLASATPPAPSTVRPAITTEAHPPAVTRSTPAPKVAPAVKGAPSAAIPVVARDWVKAPAIVEHTAPGEILAVSDLHGHYEEAFKLFAGNGVIRGKQTDPGHVEWTGGNATLVVVGDSINKGPGSVHIIDMLRQLQTEAPKFGGKVIVTLGNHEADFIHDPLSERSLRDGTGGKTGLGHEIVLHGEKPETVASGADAEGRGQWIRSLPFAAKVNDYFFVHSGNTDGMTKAGLTATIQNAVKKGGFGHDNILGSENNSVLGADDWKVTAADAARNAEKLGVKHIVMGHIPDALDSRGTIARTKDGALIKLDTGLGNDVGEARMLRVGVKGGVKQLDDDGERSNVKKHDIE